MNETLFSQIQRLFEHPTRRSVLIWKIAILIAPALQLNKLAGASARELNELAHFFGTPGISFTLGFIIHAGSSISSAA